jgi:hypothetical protein
MTDPLAAILADALREPLRPVMEDIGVDSYEDEWLAGLSGVVAAAIRADPRTVEWMMRALHARGLSCASGDDQAADFIYHRAEAAAILASTEAGRELFSDFDPMEMWGPDRIERLEAAAREVVGQADMDPDYCYDCHDQRPCAHDALRAAIGYADHGPIPRRTT